MYPRAIIFGLDLYTILLCVGIIAALLIFRVFSDRKKTYWKLQNFSIVTAVLAITAGYGSAALFQAFYNFLADRESGFHFKGTTFYGGLIGGAACFLLIYFAVGAFLFKNKIHIKSFFDIANIGAASIAAAHGFGRIGCLMAGCCHGAETDAWYGVYFVNKGIRAVPIQLFEAIFLFALFGFFCYRLIKDKKYNLSIYMLAYGIWRFVIEYFRADDRGATVVSFLTPSQLVAALMIFGSIGLFFGERRFWKKQAGLQSAEKAEEMPEEKSEGESKDEN